MADEEPELLSTNLEVLSDVQLAEYLTTVGCLKSPTDGAICLAVARLLDPATRQAQRQPQPERRPIPGPMPLYRSHKEVQALKIRHILRLEDGSATLQFSGDFPTVRVGAGFRDRINTTNTGRGGTDCGYYVVYKDGYTSWSPTKAFEEGYTEVFADGTDTVVERDGTVRGEPIPTVAGMRNDSNFGRRRGFPNNTGFCRRSDDAASSGQEP